MDGEYTDSGYTFHPGIDYTLHELYISMLNILVTFFHDKESYEEDIAKEESVAYRYRLDDEYAEKISYPEFACDNCDWKNNEEICPDGNTCNYKKFKEINLAIEENYKGEIVSVGLIYTRIDDVIDSYCYMASDDGYCFFRFFNDSYCNMEKVLILNQLDNIERIKDVFLGFDVDFSRTYRNYEKR